jgi:molybdopterin-binding protein
MISLRQVGARAGSFALHDVSFDVPRGGYGVVIGPAGAGKTTLLETIAGVIRLRAGTILLGGVDVSDVPPEARRTGIVYQHAYLFPHLTVAENVRYGASEATDADEMSACFGIDGLARRSVSALSGGERQLVALARALARRPDVLLLDEPFAALDPRSRGAARRALRTLHAERGFTALHVTHDFAEAGLVGDVAVMLDKGRVLQAGEPELVFRKPATPYVADFLGAENVFAGEVRPMQTSGAEASGAEASGADHAGHALAFTTGALTFYAVGDNPPGPAHAVIRAEEIALSTELATSSIRNQCRGRIVEIVPAGPITRVTIDASGVPLVATVTARSARELSLAPGVEVVAAFKATAIHLC